MGQTVNSLSERARKGNGYKTSPLVDKAIQKYGWENIQKEIFECSSEEELDALERQLIAVYHSDKREFGYNLESGGHTNKHLSEETKKKISDSKKGTQIGENNPFYGKHHSEETRLKFRDQHLGTHPAEETRKKMSESHSGLKHSKETINKIRKSQPFSKKVICLETKQIFPSVAEAARSNNLKSRAGITQVCDGKRHTAGGFHWAWLTNYEEKGEKYNER